MSEKKLFENNKCLLPNTRLTHTDLTPISVSLFRVKPHSHIQRHMNPTQEFISDWAGLRRIL